MLKINGKRVFNLTGQEIRLATDDDSYIAIPSEGIAKVCYSDYSRRRLESWTFVQDDGKEYKNSFGVLTPKIDECRHVADVDTWFLAWDGDFIVSFEYYFACRELGLPTDRLYTVSGAVDDWKVVEGYRALIKH